MTDKDTTTRPSFECCFCNTLTYSNFCMDCSVKIANNHDSILKFLIAMYPDAEPLNTYKQQSNSVKPQNNPIVKQQPNPVKPPNNPIVKQQNPNTLIEKPKKTDAERKRESRARLREEIGEEEFKKRATAEKRVQRTGTADSRHLLTPEEKLERRHISDKKYQEKQKAKQEQQ
jgi:hypothetical protein